MRRSTPEIKEDLATLKLQLQKARDAQCKARLHMLVLFKEGSIKTRLSVAERLAVHRNTIGNWLRLYESGGLEKLLAIGSAGAPSGQNTFSEPQLAALSAQLSDPKGFQSYNEARVWIEKQFTMRISYHTLYRILRYELKAKLKVGRKSHIKKAR